MECYRFESYVYKTGQYDTVPESGQNVSWQDLTQDKAGQYAIMDFMSYGDYVGTMIERSNCECFLEEHESNPLIWRVTGGYSSNAVLIHISLLENDEIKDIIEFLSDYPVYDDDHFSNLEWSQYSDDWIDFGQDDFIKSLQKKFEIPDETIEFITESIDLTPDDCEVVSWQSFFESLLPSGEFYIVEEAYSVYILTDNAVKDCTDEKMKKFAMQALEEHAVKRAMKLQLVSFEEE